MRFNPPYRPRLPGIALRPRVRIVRGRVQVHYSAPRAVHSPRFWIGMDLRRIRAKEKRRARR